MANLIYNLIKTHYKEYVININKDFEDALNSDEEEQKKGKETNKNSRSNSECSSKNSNSLFTKPGNCFNSKLINKEQKKGQQQCYEEDVPADFQNINKVLKSKKKKPTEEEEEMCKNKNGQKIISLISDDEQNERKLGQDNTLEYVMSQYIKTPESKKVAKENALQKQQQQDMVDELKNKYLFNNENFLGKTISENKIEEERNIENDYNDYNQTLKQTKSGAPSAKKSTKKKTPSNNEMIIESEYRETNNRFDDDEIELDAQNFQNSLLSSFQFSSKNKQPSTSKPQQNVGMKRIQVDSDQETTIPQNKDSSASSKKSSIKPLNGVNSYLSESEDNKDGQKDSNNPSKKKRKFNPKEYSNNWAILIALYCIREEFKRNSSSAKDIKLRAKSISEQIDHQFTIKSFNQIDSLVNNNLLITSFIIGEKTFSLTESGVEMAQVLYQKFVSKSLVGIQENSQENANSQTAKKNQLQNERMEEEYKMQFIPQKENKEKLLTTQQNTKESNFQQSEFDLENSFQNFLELYDEYEKPNQRSRTQINWQNSKSDTDRISSKPMSTLNNNKIETKQDHQEDSFNMDQFLENVLLKNDQQDSQYVSMANTQNSKKVKNTKKEKKVIEPLQSRNIFKEKRAFQSDGEEDEDIENEAINDSLPFSSNRSIPHILSMGQNRDLPNNSKFQDRIAVNAVAKGMIKEYEVYLLIDVRERTDKNERMLAFQQKLEAMNVNCKVENIYLGDFLWVVDITTIDEVTETYVLDYVIERKTGDDFASSIQDHRYKEQKYRYKKSGLKHCYYLVEGDVRNSKHLSVSQSTIETAIMSTQIIEQFKVQRTKSFQESIQWLSFMHKNILQNFNEYVNSLKDDHVLKFQYSMQEYQKQNKKNGNLTLKEQFGHILRAITGSGPQQVQILTEIFQTPINLISNLQNQRNLQERIELIIDQTKYNKTKLKQQGVDTKIISKPLATSIAILFGEDKYPKEKIEEA